MCLLYFIEEDHRVRLTPHSLGELSAFIIADVSGRRSDQSGNGMLLLILTHVDTGHHRVVVEKVFSQRLRQLGLTDTRRTQEDERADGSFRVLQSGTAPPYGICHSLDGLVLTDDTLVKFVFQVEQLLAFTLQHLAHGDSRPA